KVSRSKRSSTLSGSFTGIFARTAASAGLTSGVLFTFRSLLPVFTHVNTGKISRADLYSLIKHPENPHQFTCIHSQILT
ncbi:MAG: hypothetical protein Q8K26_00660, partial [Candidatus Gracilibacteria bacterium]|nr:hypothetical protein [Candidatus Gracilibacteria bacterium]